MDSASLRTICHVAVEDALRPHADTSAAEIREVLERVALIEFDGDITSYVTQVANTAREVWERRDKEVRARIQRAEAEIAAMVAIRHMPVSNYVH